VKDCSPVKTEPLWVSKLGTLAFCATIYALALGCILIGGDQSGHPIRLRADTSWVLWAYFGAVALMDLIYGVAKGWYLFCVKPGRG